VIELTPLQQDALVELLNIGFGRAAASLSQLTGHRVLLEVPQVTLQAVDELGEALGRVVRGQVASVHQIFTGRVAGDALLILDEAGAAMLKELLTNEPALPLAIDASAREVITEIGHILLNACLGTFGHLLQMHVSFSVPHLSIEHVGSILESLRIAHEEIRYALVVHAGFRLRDTQVTGYDYRPQRGVARPPDSRRRRLGAVSKLTMATKHQHIDPLAPPRASGSKSSTIAAFS
jgi:chemotaxis protein CheC